MSSAHAIIRDRIVRLLDAGTVPWHQPWTVGGQPRKLGTPGHPTYRGVNVWMLRSQGYTSPFWGSYNEMRARGGYVRAGEKATPVVFGSQVKKRGSDETFFLLTHMPVFNTDQCEGVCVPVLPEAHTDHTPLELAEKLVGNYPTAPTIAYGYDHACYIPRLDVVEMPALTQFPLRERYYSTLFHELTHSTGHPSRLARRTMGEIRPFGSPAYAKEELIAEMGATLLCGQVGIENATIDQSAAYIKGWLAALAGDVRLVVEAASAAQKAVDYITSEG